jgi:ubiquinone/menaquinone biosynthesis C-methylase UbiE
MKLGNFDSLAAAYVNRPGYSELVLHTILKLAPRSPMVAEVGAGTGKLTENLLALGLEVTAVEPSDAMRAEGVKATRGQRVAWQAGSGERTGLASGSADWLLMGSSFHWVDASKALPEFHRVLRPGGIFTAIWNPRDLEASPLQMSIDAEIRAIVPDLKRVSSGSKEFTEQMYDIVESTGHFADVIFMEARHQVEMSRERYLGVWRSVNDIQVQAGAERWAAIMDMIGHKTAGMATISSHYRSRAWTARRKG